MSSGRTRAKSGRKVRRPPARVVRRIDSADRRYYVDVESGKRVSRTAWEIDLERRRATAAVPKGKKRRKPRPLSVFGPRETHPLGEPKKRPFPKGVTPGGRPERPLREELEFDDRDLDDLIEYAEVEDEADYEEGVPA